MFVLPYASFCFITIAFGDSKSSPAVCLECEHLKSIMTDTVITIVKVNRIVAAIADPIMAVMLSGLPGETMGGVVDEMVDAGVTIAIVVGG